jgi:hypothetical protein
MALLSWTRTHRIERTAALAILRAWRAARRIENPRSFVLAAAAAAAVKIMATKIVQAAAESVATTTETDAAAAPPLRYSPKGAAGEPGTFNEEASSGRVF